MAEKLRFFSSLFLSILICKHDKYSYIYKNMNILNNIPAHFLT